MNYKQVTSYIRRIFFNFQHAVNRGKQSETAVFGTLLQIFKITLSTPGSGRIILSYMKKSIIFALCLTALIACNNSGGDNNLPAEAVPFTQVHFSDNFWAPRMEINRTVSIPSAFHQCEINGRFSNFALAAGHHKGEHLGDYPFDDTDPYKIIEGASYTLAINPDPKLDAYLDSVINIIAAAQEPDGYLTTCVTNRSERLKRWWGSERWEKINSHELYNSGHLYEAAVAHYQATGKRSLLDVAIRNADLVCQVFGPAENQKHVPSGHPIIEMALAKLYKVTGDEKYLRQARYFIEETGRGTDGHKLNDYSQDHKPILEQEEILGHAVRAGYLFSGVVDMAMLTGDTAYLEAATRLWENMAGRKLYITGGIGSKGENEGFGAEYALPNHTNYCETCASIANVYWNHRMFLATGDSRYADLLERVLYNGVISGVSLSGDLFFYDNLLASKGDIERQAWFGCACCPGNVTRFMASVPGYMYAIRNNNLYINLYATGEGSMQVNGVNIAVSQTTQYPWEGMVRFVINPERAAGFTLKLRIPGWATGAPQPGSDLYTFASKSPASSGIQIKVNGTDVGAVEIENGYASINRKWKAADEVELIIPMDIKRVEANPKVEADRGLRAIQRGPIVFCLEGVDQPDSRVFNKYIPDDAPMTFSFNPSLLNGVGEITGPAFAVIQGANDRLIEEESSFRAIPYSVWNNRGKGEMCVWIPAAADRVEL
jgi:DUF1680 family protein